MQKLLIIFICVCLNSSLYGETARIDFYGQKILLDYKPDLFQAPNVRLGYANSRTGKLQIQEYFEKQRFSGSYLTLLNELRRARKTYRLNDWLFYQLTTAAINSIGRDKSKFDRVLIRWFMLNMAGFDCRLTYLDDRAYLNVYTQDHLYELPMIEDGGRMFANVSENEYEGNAYSNLYIVGYVANPGGRSFNFSLESLPLFPVKIRSKTITFSVDTKEYSIPVQYDEMPTSIMKNYPYLSDEKYFAVPISGTLQNSIIPKFRKILADKTEREALSVIASFTRNAFDYMLDEEHFGKSRPMIPEEVFHFPYSDCEDRCALFFALTKELLDLPLIVLSFDDHLSVAVAPKEDFAGEAIRFDQRNYYVCDPTGPSNSSDVGFFPKGYREKDFEIIARYK